MKQSRTTLKELTAAYRAVLRHGILCNAIALGLIATAPAMAETITERTTLDGTDYVAVANGGLTFSGISSTDGKGALTVTSGAIDITGDSLSFTGNTSSQHGAALYYKDQTATTGAVLDVANISFANNTSGTANAEIGSSAGAILNTGGSMSILGGTNSFTDNSVLGADADSAKWYKRGGGAIANQSYWKESDHSVPINAVMVIGKNDGSSTNTFANNSSSTNGGAIMNRAVETDGDATLTINGTTTFDNNTATFSGGAIYNIQRDGRTATLNLTNGTYTFTNNAATGTSAEYGKGGAVYNEGIMTLSNATFGGAERGNSAEKGGAIYNKGTLTMTDATLDSNFSTNGHGGAVYNEGTLNITDVTMNLNRSADGKSGGAIYNNTGGVVVISGGEITNNVSGNYAGAIYSASDGNVTINGTLLQGNTAIVNGGAIYNNTGTLSITDGTLIDNHTNGKGAGIYNKSGVVTLTDTAIQNNVVDTELDAGGGVDGGAGIYNLKGLVTINATNEDITLSGNRIDLGNYSFDSDIYNGNSGTLTLNAAANRTLTLDGGIDGGGAGTMYVNAGAANTGVVKIAGTLNGQHVTVAHGELHLIDDDPTLYPVENAYLAGSTINVASDATINTIDDAIQDLSSIVTLADGAAVKGDIDYIAGVADTYSAATGANITYKLANALNLSGMQYGAQKEIRVTNEGATVNAGAGFAWYNSVEGLTLTSGGAGTGTVFVAGVSGGINAAVDSTDETIQEIAYNATAATETFDGAGGTDNVIQNADVTVTGNGNDTTSNKIVFEEDMIVDGTSTLSINNVVLEKDTDEAIENKLGGTLNFTEARVGVNVRNFGTMVSDPTYYGAEVWNSGTASFTGDVFESGSSLTNSATVNLNNVEFVAGSSLIGNTGNVLNIIGTGNIFNGASSGNNVILASGANYTGTLYDGSIDARNGGIDTITGSVSGGDLYVDADLAAGSTDTFGGISNTPTIKGVKLANTGYGTADSVTLEMTGATFDANVDIDGFSYYTNMTNNGNTLVFNDKLINESNLDTKLGGWSGGHYIKASTSMTQEADTDHLTVGQALSALDTQLYTVSTPGAVADGDTGFVTGDTVYDTLANYSTTDQMNTAIGNALNTAVADGGVVDNAIDSAINTAVGTGGAVTNAINGALSNYTTTTDMNTAISNAKDEAVSAANTYTDNKITAALGTVTDGVTAVYDQAHAWAEGLLGVDVDSNTDVQLQDALGTTSVIDSETKTIAGALKDLDSGVAAESTRAQGVEDSLATRLTTAETTVGNHESALTLLAADETTAGSVAHAAANATANANAYTDAQLSLARTATLADANAYTDRRIEDLDKNLSAGVAGAVALSSVAVSGVERGEVSVGAGYGYFNGQSAAAFGATMGLSNRWSINAGAGISNADVSFRAGTNYKFKLF